MYRSILRELPHDRRAFQQMELKWLLAAPYTRGEALGQSSHLPENTAFNRGLSYQMQYKLVKGLILCTAMSYGLILGMYSQCAKTFNCSTTIAKVFAFNQVLLELCDDIGLKMNIR